MGCIGLTLVPAPSTGRPDEDPYDWRIGRLLRRLAPGLAALVVLSPLLRAPASDTYPLSTYPMFATNRGEIHTFATVVGETDTGEVVRLSPHVIAGTDEVVLASVTVERAVARGREEGLCAEVAERASDELHSIIVRSERIDLIAHFSEEAAPLSITEHTRCEVSR